jgi:nitroreductase
MHEQETRTAANPSAESTETRALAKLLAERHSCRAFLSKPVPRPIIRGILEIAQRTATWCNTQPWQVVVTEPAATERLRAALYARAATDKDARPDLPWPREYRGVSLQRRRESGFALYQALGIARDDMAARDRQMLENFRFFGAPHVALITSDEALGPYGAVDCGGYVANFVLAAQSHGVATIAQAALAHQSAFLRQYFQIADDRLVICGISFGYADPSHPANAFRTTRVPIDDAVTWAE